MFYTPKNDFTNFATMKKIALFVFLLLIAVISFGQTVPVRAKTFQITYGSDSYSINLNGDSILIDASKFIWFAKKFGSDTLLFGDGTYMTTAFVMGVNDTVYVKTTGDTLWGTYNFGTTGSYLQYDNIFLSSPSGDYGIDLYTDDTEATIGLFGEDKSNAALQIRSSGFVFSRDDDGLNHFALNTMKIINDSSQIADDASIILTNGISGWGEMYVFNAGTIDEWAEFIISSDGTVYLKSNSTDVVNTDTDNKLCIFDNGSGVTIRNRLGGVRTIKYIIHH